MLEKLVNLGEIFNVVQIYGDLKSVNNYIKDNPVDMLIFDEDYDSFELERIIDYIKRYRPKIKIAVIYNDSSVIVKLYNKGIIVNKAIKNNIETDDLRELLLNLNTSSLSGDVLITRLLDQFDFNKTNIGYHYIVECLNYCIDSKLKQIPKLKKMYEIVSDDIYSPNQINWNVRKAINSMNRLTDENTIKKYFAYNILPTPKEFLNRMLDIYYRIH